MNDRELLERAARAAGIAIRPGYSFQTGMFFIDVRRPDGVVAGRAWNPLTDDGDALRLLIALPDVSLELFGADPVITYPVSPIEFDFLSEPAGSDKAAATRLAIVRAAAALAGQKDA